LRFTQTRENTNEERAIKKEVRKNWWKKRRKGLAEMAKQIQP